MEASKEGPAGDAAEEIDTSHLDAVDDGCGCAEVWEEMSEQREASD